MTNAYVGARGDAALASALRSPKARDLAERLSEGSLPFAWLVECRTMETVDTVVLEVEPEIPQVREHDIRPVERVAVCFDHDDSRTPQFFALREDFPATAHLYPPVDAVPKQLCLFEEEHADLRRRWTAAFFVRRLQDWLRLTARGELHADDQPLEQALAGTGNRIILPHALATPGDVGRLGQAVELRVTGDDEHRGALLILTARIEGVSEAGHGRYSALSFTSRPHGPAAITVTPRTISELHAFLATEGDDLIGVLRRRLMDWPRSDNALDSQLILIVRIPKQRRETAQIESVETWAFLAPTARQLGTALGVWDSTPNGFGLMIPPREDRRGETAPLNGLAVHFRISRLAAAQLNGRDRADDRRVVAIGAGALGSQVILNSARTAFGRWTIVDRDRLLPHNVVRHGLGEFGVGHHKAIAVASVANGLTDDEPAFEALVADVLAPGQDRERINEHLKSASLVVDLAASVPVARYLALEAPGSARRVSQFLNPTGSDLVMLVEDRERTVRLDMLEMQYYRAVLRDPRLREHLRRPDERVRYGRSCRDVSLRLPQELVGLHAAIAARQLRVAAEDDGAAIYIWRSGGSALEVSASSIGVSPVTRRELRGWNVAYDDELVETIQRLRTRRLPNETGGILLGAYDVERKIVYVVDTIPSPVDSDERRTLYIRGHAGLREDLEAARRQTLDQIEYVGEWHSHPDGIGSLPSEDDLNVLHWLAGHMDADGVPGVMMIACEHDSPTVLLAQMVRA